MPCLISVNVHRPTRLRRAAAYRNKSFVALSGTGLSPAARGLSVFDCYFADEAPALVPHFNEFMIPVSL